jgi:hypothetical protein
VDVPARSKSKKVDCRRRKSLALPYNQPTANESDGWQSARALRCQSVTETVSQQNAPARTALAWISAGVVGAVLLIAFIGPLDNEFHLTLFPQDEGLLLTYPSLILKGAIPNRSFESVYGVVNLWIIAGAFKLAGFTVAVERAVGIAYRFVIFGSLVVLAWRHRGPLAALVAGVLCVVLLVGTLGLAAYAWFCALAFAALALLMIDIGMGHAMKRLPVAIGGICFGLALGSRLDMSLAVLLVCIVLAIYRRDCLPWLILGLVIGLVPLVVNIAQAGLPAVVRDQLIQPIFVSGPSRQLPLSSFSQQELVLVFLCVVVAAASVASGFMLLRRGRREWESVLLLALGAFELGLVPQAFQRSDVAHLAQVGCFVLPAAVMLPCWHIPRMPVLKTVNVIPILVGIVVLLMAYPFFGRLYRAEFGLGGNLPVEYTVSNDGRSVPVAGETNKVALSDLLHQIDDRARPGQRVFVGPLDLRTANYNDTFIYFLLPNLTPGSYYLEMNPGVANGKNSQLASDLRRDEFLVLTGQYDSMFDPDASTRTGSNVPNEVVHAQFQQIGLQGPWKLFQRR